jgi:hypothetical protein
MENPIRRARSPEEFSRLVEVALLETEELRASIGYDEAFMSEALGFVHRLQAGLEDIHRRLDVSPIPLPTRTSTTCPCYARPTSACCPSNSR